MESPSDSESIVSQPLNGRCTVAGFHVDEFNRSASVFEIDVGALVRSLVLEQMISFAGLIEGLAFSRSRADVVTVRPHERDDRGDAERAVDFHYAYSMSRRERERRRPGFDHVDQRRLMSR
jgi:hypothetical protein